MDDKFCTITHDTLMLIASGKLHLENLEMGLLWMYGVEGIQSIGAYREQGHLVHPLQDPVDGGVSRIWRN